MYWQVAALFPSLPIPRSLGGPVRLNFRPDLKLRFERLDTCEFRSVQVGQLFFEQGSAGEGIELSFEAVKIELTDRHRL
jgi:hypothetical protein